MRQHGFGDGRSQPAASPAFRSAPYAQPVESRLGRAGVLGRSRPQPGGAGRRPDRGARRDGATESPRWCRCWRPTRPMRPPSGRPFGRPARDAGKSRRAIASFERTLVSGQTRFDRWVEGDEALTADERAGFRPFTGKGQCGNCHSGWAFTDYAFHDIGLSGDDRGRGAVLRLRRQSMRSRRRACARSAARRRTCMTAR